MPVVLTEAPTRAIPPVPPRKLWTRVECSALEARGGLDYRRLELVEGELIDKLGKNWSHASAQESLHLWFIQVFGAGLTTTEAMIDVSPEDNPTSEPIPDLVVLKRSIRGRRTNPRPAELLLVTEVADSSLAFDLNIKAALYARAGIAEYWVLDINGRRLIVHRDPRDGRYQWVTA